MIHIDTLSKTFSGGKGLDRVSLHIKPGEMVALIGSSGSGKSTLMRHIAGLMPGDADGGRIEVAQHLIQDRGVISRDIRTMRAEIGMVFQQFNLVDRMSVLRNVMLGALSRTALWRSLLGFFHEEDARLAYKALARVGIMEKAHQRTSNLSGGQQQRAAIARAVALEPALLVCDEPVASLDVSIQAQVLELLYKLRNASHMSMLFVSHNLNVVRYICDRVVVMYLGRIVEMGDVDEIFKRPKHPYTKLLMASTPGADASVIRFYPKGSMPSPIDRPKGCVFANRCPVASARCHEQVPTLTKLSDNHACACFEQKAFEALQATEGEA